MTNIDPEIFRPDLSQALQEGLNIRVQHALAARLLEMLPISMVHYDVLKKCISLFGW